MRTATVLSRIPFNRISFAATLVAVAMTASSCGGSAATSMTAPTSINRCAIAMQGLDTPLPAEGGSASIAVTAVRESAWSASVEGSWLSIKTGASGQGDGVVESSATSNPDPQMRRGAVSANGQRAEVSQSAGTCDIVLGQSAASFNQGGGTGQLQVRASSQMCGWNACSDADWIQLRTSSGQGNRFIRGALVDRATTQRHHHHRRTEVQRHAVRGVRLHNRTALAVSTSLRWKWRHRHHHHTGVSVDSREQRRLADREPAIREWSGVCHVCRRSDYRTFAHWNSGRGLAAVRRHPIAGCSYVVQPSSGQTGSGGGTLPVTVSERRV